MSDQYTPTTEQVRFAYIDRRDFESQVGLGERPGDEEAGAEFDRWLASVKAEAWDEAKREVATIPCWADPETGLHGFDLQDETEQGARMEVMRILDNNPYRKETP